MFLRNYETILAIRRYFHFAFEQKSSSSSSFAPNILTISLHIQNALCKASHSLSLIRLQRGSGDSSVVRASDSWSKGPGFESREERQENFPLHCQLSVMTFISVSVPPPCYRSNTNKSPGHALKSAGGRLCCYTHMHPTMRLRIK